MVFQPIGRAEPRVTTGPGELLPHLLTLTPVARGGCFLPRYHTLTDIFFTEVWRSALPGLSFPRLPGERQTVLLDYCKIRIKFGTLKFGTLKFQTLSLRPDER